MREIRLVAVIDVGKTNAKVALVEIESLTEVAVHKTPNKVSTDGPYPHHDVDRLWDFILDSLAMLNRNNGVDAISVTTHGATAALVDRNGDLALPVLDYESPAPDALTERYDAVRPAFSETGSPRLPVGLNLGAQLFWQQAVYPARFAEVAAILMYPQYWVCRLTGIAANEVTSLGCHTDLWNPAARSHSSMVDRLGWRALMAPVRPARHRIGEVRSSVAERAGLDLATPVYCGIHDSNASLLPHLITRKKPFSVVSTGTWVIAMALGSPVTVLDPAKDTLVNVNADGDPVPSARFMGGREYEIITEGRRVPWADADVEAVIEGGTFLMPSVQQGSGPFPSRRSAWIAEGRPTPAQRHAALSFYLALMTAVGLELIEADGDTIVEGPFAKNELYLAMLASATGRAVRQGSDSGTGTSIGAALLAVDRLPAAGFQVSGLISPDLRLAAYAERWKARAASSR